MSAFDEANKVVHSVTTQWHYPILINAGFVAETKEAVGFVRSYVYRHADGRVVTCTTGYSADYWRAADKCMGYHSTLKNYCDGTFSWR